MYSLSLEAFTLMLEEFLKIGSGCAVSNGQGTDSTAIWTQVRKKNKEDGPTEENTHSIKHSLLYCINSALESCLCTKNKFSECVISPWYTGPLAASMWLS